MRDILEELLTGNYSTKFHYSKAYQARVEEDDALWNKVLDVFGIEYVDHLWESVDARNKVDCGAMFRHGFHLGALLMLDLLYDAPERETPPSRTAAARKITHPSPTS